MVLSSPLGTAGIRGTMFQLVAVRNPVTGDITGGVNLISGDISLKMLEGTKYLWFRVNLFNWHRAN